MVSLVSVSITHGVFPFSALRILIIFTRIYPGANREIKKAVEAYWGGKISADELTKVAADVKKTNWTSLKERGVDVIPRCVVSQVRLVKRVIHHYVLQR